jgi:hypothetical protein
VDEDESAEVTPLSEGRSASGRTTASTRNAEVFKAKTSCFSFDQDDDHVKFVDGSPNGACASAKIPNMPTGVEPKHQYPERRGAEDAYFYLWKLGYVIVARNFAHPAGAVKSI